MSDTFVPDAEVVLSMTGKTLPAVVLKDDGGDTVVVRFDHPTLEGETTAIPILRAFVTRPGEPLPDVPSEPKPEAERVRRPRPEAAASEAEPVAAAESAPSLVPEPVAAEEVVLHGQDLAAPGEGG